MNRKLHLKPEEISKKEKRQRKPCWTELVMLRQTQELLRVKLMKWLKADALNACYKSFIYSSVWLCISLESLSTFCFKVKGHFLYPDSFSCLCRWKCDHMNVWLTVPPFLSDRLNLDELPQLQRAMVCKKLWISALKFSFLPHRVL